jgi:HEPN domain-containing protein
VLVDTVKHTELRSLAETRLKDAQVLFKAGRYDAAAYMCGYVLELALKACVCKRLGISEYPPERLKREFKTHSFDDLLLLAGLSEKLTAARDPVLFGKWSQVAGWEPDWRYRRPGSVVRQDAEAMLGALCKRPDGLLAWLRRRW